VQTCHQVVSNDLCRDNFEKAVAALEHARFALAFASGSATTATILQSLAQGSHVVSVSDVYGGTHRYFTKVAAAHGVQVTFSPSLEVDIAELIRPNETKLIWIESPSNPTLSLVDIRNVASVAHGYGIMVVLSIFRSIGCSADVLNRMSSWAPQLSTLKKLRID